MADRVRASDAEREEYALILRAAMTEGRLTLEEGEDRLGQAYAAKFRDELPQLTDDLPDGGRQALHDTPEAKEQRRLDGRRHLSHRFGRLVVVGAILTGLWMISDAQFFWPIIPLAFMTHAMFKHGRFHHHRHHWSR